LATGGPGRRAANAALASRQPTALRDPGERRPQRECACRTPCTRKRLSRGLRSDRDLLQQRPRRGRAPGARAAAVRSREDRSRKERRGAAFDRTRLPNDVLFTRRLPGDQPGAVLCRTLPKQDRALTAHWQRLLSTSMVIFARPRMELAERVACPSPRVSPKLTVFEGLVMRHRCPHPRPRHPLRVLPRHLLRSPRPLRRPPRPRPCPCPGRPGEPPDGAARRR
jgi:hypothetical protein